MKTIFINKSTIHDGMVDYMKGIVYLAFALDKIKSSGTLNELYIDDVSNCDKIVAETDCGTYIVFSPLDDNEVDLFKTDSDFISINK